jgi:antibiotic biosynthesis monooxygenase (ABM) superfamily enzyme
VSDEAVEPVSTRVSRMVPAGKVARFEPLLHEMITAARRFDGHLGVDVLRPDDGGVYQIIFRYRSRAEQQAWMASDQRRALAARIDRLLDDGTTAEVRAVDGWEGWFVTPAYAPPAPPRRWKMAVVTFAALYPLLLALITILRPVTGDWPVPLTLLVTLGLTIPLMTWLVMPLLTVRLGTWLRRS